jgi:hypothetical protein
MSKGYAIVLLDISDDADIGSTPGERRRSNNAMAP